MARFGMDLQADSSRSRLPPRLTSSSWPSACRVAGSWRLRAWWAGAVAPRWWSLRKSLALTRHFASGRCLPSRRLWSAASGTGPSPGRRWRHGGLRSDGRGGFCRNRCGAGPGGGSAPGQCHRPGRQGAAAQGVGGTCPPGVNPGRPGSVASAWVGLGGEKGQGLRCPCRGHARRGPGSGAPAAGRGCLPGYSRRCCFGRSSRVLRQCWVPLALGAWEARARSVQSRELAQEMPAVFRTLSVAMGSGQTLAQAVEYVGTHRGESRPRSRSEGSP